MISLPAIVEHLLEHYGARGWWPLVGAPGEQPVYVPGQYHSERTPRQVFEIGVGAVLTQRAAWRNVSPVLARLSTLEALSPRGMEKLDDTTLHETIRSCGTFRRKAVSLRAWAAWCLRNALTRSGIDDQLERLPGFGPETVDSILLYGLGVPRFIADAYARRILLRVGLVETAPDYRNLQEQVHEQQAFDRRICDEGHALLVEVGKRHCHPKPVCDGCPLNARCRRVGVGC